MTEKERQELLAIFQTVVGKFVAFRFKEFT